MQTNSNGVPATERVGSGWAPGFTSKLMAALTRGRGKKTSGRTNNPPAERLAQHHLARWKDEGRQALVVEAMRLGLLGTDRPFVGRRPWAQFSSWKTLAVAVERARRIKMQDVGL